MIIFVARDSKTFKAYKIPDMQHSKYDDFMRTKKCIEIGLTIKDWSRDKSMRDMKTTLPDYEESALFNNYLQIVDKAQRQDDNLVVTMSSTERSTRLLM